jgi:enterochelin esterase-like enzyme
VFLMNEFESSVMLGVTKKGAEYRVEELWSTSAIKRSYVTPVHHDGHLYGMSNRIFTCIDAATGETRWRSREPGDGFPTIVGDKLVVITKPGSLHVAQASPAGYEELARLDLFEEHSWSEVAYASGHLYARSMARLARIDPDAGSDSAGGAASWIEATGFGRFLAEVEQAESKTAVIDAFLERQSAFPIIEETGAVHFVYRGEAQDVGIVGDMIGYRREDPMIRVDGTDLFHYSTRLEPDAAVAYGFIPEYGEALPDPRNSNRDASGLFGDVSWFAMPAWPAPDPLDDRGAARAGRLDGVEWESAVREGQQRTATVYLPPGYAESDRRYPVIYVHNGNAALETGRTKDALDRSIGTAVDPLIAVFVTADQEDLDEDLDWESYAEMIVKELIPLIDGKYRTLDERLERASVGSGREAANVAMFLAFKHPELFGRVAGQSSTLAPENLDTLHGADETPMVIYLEWGRYHRRSPHEAWSDVDGNRQMWSALREAGYRPAGGETAEGYAWAFWRAHSAEMLRALFPLRE